MAFHFEFKAIGTTWVIDIGDVISNEIEISLKDTVLKRTGEFEQNYSRFRNDSLVTKMSHNAGTYTLPDDAQLLFEVYKKLYVATGGMVSPFMGQTLSDAGYDASYSLTPKPEITKPPKWEDILDYNHPKITLKKPILFDFGAAGKGYLVDIVSEIINKAGIKNYTVNAGGDIAYKNIFDKKLRVGLENPEDFKQVLGVAEIINQSICGSAGSRRAWGEYTHIINPETGKSPENILAIWVTADNTVIADGLTTALFFTEPEKIRGMFKCEYAIVYSDHSAKVSPSFPGNFFSE